ncbi:MAG: hypothetical protein ACERLG_11095 [Sedimentibacter sp.]
MRVGSKATQNIEFYEKFSTDRVSIKTLVKDKEKFSFEVPGDRLLKSFTKAMCKMDFWI